MKKFFSLLAAAVLLAACGTTQSLPTQSSSTTYKVGDIYSQNGLSGVVVVVDDSGKHGFIMSLTASKDKWLANKELEYSTNAFFDDDGEKNMAAIEACIKENNVSWADFPAFAWARSLGEGWYIPSRVEGRMAMMNLDSVFNDKDVSVRAKKVNKIFTTYGGDRIMYHKYTGTGILGLIGSISWYDAGLVDLITSTEKTGGKLVWTTSNSGVFKTVKANTGVFGEQIRAIHKF